MRFTLYITILLISFVNGDIGEESTQESDDDVGKRLIEALPFYFDFGEKNIPHIDKRAKGGEDGWTASSSLLVIADGVGGWAR